MERRPVLGQQFEEAPHRARTSRGRLPSFFSNLLPEGSLRRSLASAHGVDPNDDFSLLEVLGADLAGAVQVTPAGVAEDVASGAAIEEPAQTAGTGRLRFSVAGVQLKYSMSRSDKGWVLPADGVGGDWLVKISSGRFPGLARNELCVMKWAAASGLSVPDCELVTAADLDSRVIGGGFEDEAFAIRRFDRTADAHRIHQEDFAQVIGFHPDQDDQKYGGRYERLVLLVSRLCGESCGYEVLRRLAFMVACGNGDAHWKNWALLYADGVRAELAPVYDFVSTIAYAPDLPREMALKFGGSRVFENVGEDVVKRAAREAGLAPDQAWDEFRDTLVAARAAWPDAALLGPESVVAAVRQHWARVAVLRSVGGLLP